MQKLRGRMLPSKRRALIILPFWTICVVWLSYWWLQTDRVNFLPLFIPLTAAMFYEFIFLPSVFIYFLLKVKLPPLRKIYKNQKVAVISLCVPSSESKDIVEKQLIAMKAIDYPHDSWILDEGNSKIIKKMAQKYGIKYFSRKGIKKYNQEIPPFKSKTKAGNVNAWLDHVKRRKYDFFVQFDIDHLAKPIYLNKTLGFFRDKKVAWVQAPSLYKNHNYWTSRGASEQELVFQGPLQMGFYGHSNTPFIIGSHTTYRISAVREIGGFQPTRAEDHLDTVALAGLGYTGVFLPEVIAEGDGPETLSTYLAQQFAWAFSMFQVLLWHGPTLIKHAPLNKKLQFIFAQSWYPLWALSYLTMFMSPIVSLLINRDIASVDANDFTIHFLPLFVCSFLIWWSSRPIMHPRGLNLTWRGILLHVVRWPVVLIAVLSALVKIKKPYMITPKGKFAHSAPTLEVYKPFLFLGLLSTFAVIASSILYKGYVLQGQAVYAILNALFMFMICAVDINILLRKAKISLNIYRGGWLKPVGATICLTTAISYSIVTIGLAYQQNAYAVAGTIPYNVVSISYPSDDDVTTNLLTQIKRTPPINTLYDRCIGYYTDTTLPASKLNTRHVFENWDSNKKIAQQILAANRQDTRLLITLEPRSEDSGGTLLANITNGTYDSLLSKLSLTLSASNNTIYIRFAHEMELGNLYSWGNQDHSAYIASYRYVVAYLREHGATNVKWVWSPAGNYGSEIYYPGDDVVDVVGTTVLQDPYWSQNYQPTFAELVKRRLWLTQFGKPLWLVEFGIGSDDPDYQSRLIDEALSTYATQGFDCLLYLYAADSNIIGIDYRVNNLELLRHFEQ